MRAIACVLIAVLVHGAVGASPAQGQTAASALTPRAIPLSGGGGDTISPTQADQFCCDKRYFWPAAGEVGLLLVIPHFFNRRVADDSTAILTLDSWKRNILEGFEWDRDNFKTNMFAHPYHGGVYFNSARSNGYNFWESSLFAWGGSFLWELFGENNRPAINDWISTAAGGMALGEMLHRTSLMLRDNTASGTERTFRELGGLLLNPMGAASRLFRGEMTKIGPNPSDRFPGQVRSFAALGFRRVGDGTLKNGDSYGFFAMDVAYGNPFEEYARPFDSFSLSFQVNGREEKQGLGRLQVEGTLYGTELKRSDRVHHVFHITQHFDYVDNQTLETGGSSVSAGLLSRFSLSQAWNLSTMVEPTALLIWGTNSEYADFTRRNYDFGSGLALRLSAAANHRNRQMLRFFYYFIWQHTLDGAVGDHLMQYLGARAAAPLWRGFGLGGEYVLTVRDSKFRDFPDVFRQNPQFRLFAAVYLD